MVIGSSLFLLMGIFSLCYLVAIVLYAGMKTAFLWFWISLGIGSILISAIMHYMYSHKIGIPWHLKLGLTTLLIIGTLFFLTVEGTIISKGRQKPEDKADYVIVLGAQVKGSTISRALKNRLDAALTYLIKNSNTKVIVSGGQGRGEDISEAEAMSRYLISKGIKADRIIKEDKSTNTFQNIKFSKNFMTIKEPHIVLVTNSFHVFRATSIAKKQGITQVQGLGAPSDDLLTLSYYIREFFAVVKDKLIGNI